MKLKLTPDVLRAAYGYLSETEPFVRWNLPDSDSIDFIVTASRSTYGRCFQWSNGTIGIEISARKHGSTDVLMRTMAHEMIHVHETHNKLRKTSDHDKVFHRFARQVCAVHGFDEMAFVD